MAESDSDVEMLRDAFKKLTDRRKRKEEKLRHQIQVRDQQLEDLKNEKTDLERKKEEVVVNEAWNNAFLTFENQTLRRINSDLKQRNDSFNDAVLLLQEENKKLKTTKKEIEKEKEELSNKNQELDFEILCYKIDLRIQKEKWEKATKEASKTIEDLQEKIKHLELSLENLSRRELENKKEIEYRGIKIAILESLLKKSEVKSEN